MRSVTRTTDAEAHQSEVAVVVYAGPITAAQLGVPVGHPVEGRRIVGAGVTDGSDVVSPVEAIAHAHQIMNPNQE